MTDSDLTARVAGQQRDLADLMAGMGDTLHAMASRADMLERVILAGRRTEPTPLESAMHSTGYFYTNSFPESDVRLLASRLTAMGVRASAQRCGGAQRHEWRIHITVPGVRALLALIGPCPVPSYAYKWNAGEVYRDWHHPDGRMAKLKVRDFA